MGGKTIGVNHLMWNKICRKFKLSVIYSMFYFTQDFFCQNNFVGKWFAYNTQIFAYMVQWILTNSHNYYPHQHPTCYHHPISRRKTYCYKYYNQVWFLREVKACLWRKQGNKPFKNNAVLHSRVIKSPVPAPIVQKLHSGSFSFSQSEVSCIQDSSIITLK